MRLRRFEARDVGRLRLPLRRRTMVQGGLGLVTSAVLGGLSDSYDRYVLADPEPAQPPVAEPPPEPVPAPPAELAFGVGGERVWALQEQLNATGYWCGAPDGGFGHLTQQAVFAVQKAHGLVRDGVVGPVTEAAVASGYRPAPVAGGDHVEVHVGSQLLLFVRGGATVMVLNTSTGNGEPYDYKGHEYIAHTPPGDFAVWYTDGSGWRDGDLGEMWRPMFYSGDYAIHGSASIPPWPASHGCARVSTAAMDMIWAEGMLQMGGRVLVV